MIFRPFRSTEVRKFARNFSHGLDFYFWRFLIPDFQIPKYFLGLSQYLKWNGNSKKSIKIKRETVQQLEFEWWWRSSNKEMKRRLRQRQHYGLEVCIIFKYSRIDIGQGINVGYGNKGTKLESINVIILTLNQTTGCLIVKNAK